MTTTPLTHTDLELIDVARQLITQRVAKKKHNLATAMLTATGQVITGINMEGSFGCNDVCAEQITLGSALSAGATDITTVVTVRHPKVDEDNQTLRVANPCGKCRELLIDYAPTAWVIIRQDDDSLVKCRASELVPLRYRK